MNPEVYDGYRTAAGHAQQLADWWLLQLDTWGLAIFLTVHAAMLLAAWCLIGATCHLAERIRDRAQIRQGIRRLEQYASHPASRVVLDDFHQPRKETP